MLTNVLGMIESEEELKKKITFIVPITNQIKKRAQVTIVNVIMRYTLMNTLINGIIGTNGIFE